MAWLPSSTLARSILALIAVPVLLMVFVSTRSSVTTQVAANTALTLSQQQAAWKQAELDKLDIERQRRKMDTDATAYREVEVAKAKAEARRQEADATLDVAWKNNSINLARYKGRADEESTMTLERSWQQLKGEASAAGIARTLDALCNTNYIKTPELEDCRSQVRPMVLQWFALQTAVAAERTVQFDGFGGGIHSQFPAKP